MSHQRGSRRKMAASLKSVKLLDQRRVVKEVVGFSLHKNTFPGAKMGCGPEMFTLRAGESKGQPKISEALLWCLSRAETMETYTELNVVASDLHESDPEEMWSNDLGWVPKSDLQAARDKEVTKLQEFDTFEEVPQDEAEIPSAHGLLTNGKRVEN